MQGEVTQIFQAWFPDDIKEVKGGASWKMKVVSFLLVFLT